MLKVFLWCLICAVLIYFFINYLFPYLQNQWILWRVNKKLKKIINNCEGETKEKLEHVSELIDYVRKTETVFDDEDNNNSI